MIDKALILTGPRVTLRPLTLEDAVDLRDIRNDRKVCRLTFTEYPATLAKARQIIKAAQIGARTGTRYTLAIELKGQSGIIGVVSLFEIDKTHKNAEIGCVLARSHWRQGLMTEAMLLALQFAFRKLRLRRVYAFISIKNIPPQRLVESLGFTREGLLRKCRFRGGKFRDYYVYGMLKEETPR
ncbi:MAG TPA: GNAT family N-acetyltransferase [Candidatus Acidoferrum sp.]|nr:GNAT family N-acetyltransferase [Candidatus Acidoferrum sp.]